MRWGSPACDGLSQWKETLRIPPALGRRITPFTFAIIADPHCVESPSSRKHGKRLEHLGDGVQRFRMCIDAVQALREPAVDFLVLLGDIGIDAADQALHGIPYPIHAIAGNHDCGEQRWRLRTRFPEHFGTGPEVSDYYASDFRGVRLAFLCTGGTATQHTGQLTAESIRPPGQPAWLARQLSLPGTLTLLFGHAPPQPVEFDLTAYMSDGHRDSPYLQAGDSDLLVEMLRQVPAAAFFGHLHRATHDYRIGASHVHVVRSCNWNHEDAFVGFLLVRVTRESLSIREICTGLPT